MLNNFAEFSHARTCPVSVASQVMNYPGTLIEDTLQKLLEERKNQHLSTTDPTLLDHLYLAEVPVGFFFVQQEEEDGYLHYTPPTVYATINNTEIQIEQAENNNIETLYYDCLPTRIEYDNQQILWVDIIPETEANNIGEITPADFPINGHLYVTIKDNYIWQREFKNQLYFSKITITGTSRKGTEITEVVPLRINATFQTINQWKSISEVYISHISDDAKITVSCLPLAEDPVLDPLNLFVPVEGGDRIQFISIEDESFGSLLIAKSFINDDLDIVRLGTYEMRENYCLELLDENGSNISANGFMLKPNSQLFYVIDNYYFYVYDRRLPYPAVSGMIGESPDCRIELTLVDSDWIYKRNEIATVTTRTVDLWAIPTRFRWSITVPNGTTYRVGFDGSYWDENTPGWISNIWIDEGKWLEQILDFTLDQIGVYIISFDAEYQEEDKSITSRTSKLLLYVPAIQPEVQIPLPESLRFCRQLSQDSDGLLWLYNGTSIFRTKLFYDYFAVDYEKKYIWLHEQYNNIRILP
jgi:hypothetical protein